MNLNKFYYIFSLIVFLQIFFLQIKKLDINKLKSCLKIFKSNNMLGLLVLINLMIGTF